MKSIDELSQKLGPGRMAWLAIWRRKHGLTAEEICKRLHEKTGDQIDPASIEAYLQSKSLQTMPSADPDADLFSPATAAQFTSAMERDIELALLLQLDSLGLTLFVNEEGKTGQQYHAAEFGRIDLLTTKSNGDFVVIELKRDDAPRATIGQIAGYIAFVKKALANSNGRSVFGWILARPSSPTEDRVLEESANAVGIVVKWYSVRLDFLEGGS